MKTVRNKSRKNHDTGVHNLKKNGCQEEEHSLGSSLGYNRRTNVD
mgnify:CR=1 FL=1